MHSERSYFIDYQALTVPQSIYGIGPDCLQAFGIGSVVVFDDKKHRRTLKSVLHVSKLKHGLFSITTATLMGWRSVFENGGCTVSHWDFQFYSVIKDKLC